MAEENYDFEHAWLLLKRKTTQKLGNMFSLTRVLGIPMLSA